jgi:hypothetical protein
MGSSGGEESSAASEHKRPVWERKPQWMCHVCERNLGEQALAPATLFGGRLRACADCLKAWPSIEPDDSEPPQRRHRRRRPIVPGQLSLNLGDSRAADE